MLPILVVYFFALSLKAAIISSSLSSSLIYVLPFLFGFKPKSSSGVI